MSALKSNERLFDVIFEEQTPSSSIFSNEKDTAIAALREESRFKLLHEGYEEGPYSLSLSKQDDKLHLKIKVGSKTEAHSLGLSLHPYRKIMQDYFLMIESYERGRATMTREKLEAIDMGRRGIHNEGAELLQKRLNDKIEMDFETARRLFTLFCMIYLQDSRGIAF